MQKREIKYRDIVNSIDVTAFEEAIGFEPIYSRGENDVGKCVFPDKHSHGDTTGKFAIHRGKRIYNCFVCGGGSFLSLAMQLYGFEQDEALSWLAQFTKSDVVNDTDFVEGLLANISEEKEKIAALPYFNEAVLDKQFSDETDWFLKRGISQEVIDAYRLCYTKEAYRRGKEEYTGPAAIFPHFWKDQLVGWQYRWMDWPDIPKWLPKYTNTRDFPRSTTIFNYDQAIKSRSPVIVCESVPTVLMLISNGYSAVSTFGGGVSEDQLKLLRRFRSGLYLAPDNDKEGSKFLVQATLYLQQYIDVKHIPKTTELGPKTDLGDLVKTHYIGEDLEKAIAGYIAASSPPYNI